MMPFPIFEQYTATVTKKIKFHYSRYEIKLWHCSTEGQSWDEPRELHSIPPDASSGLPDEGIFPFIVCYEAPQTWLNSPSILLTWRWILLLSRSANTGESAYQNLKPRILANTTVTSKKIGICNKIIFFCLINYCIWTNHSAAHFLDGCTFRWWQFWRLPNIDLFLRSISMLSSQQHCIFVITIWHIESKIFVYSLTFKIWNSCLLNDLKQLCPNETAYWAKNNVIIVTRVAHWMT